MMKKIKQRFGQVTLTRMYEIFGWRCLSTSVVNLTRFVSVMKILLLVVSLLYGALMPRAFTFLWFSLLVSPYMFALMNLCESRQSLMHYAFVLISQRKFFIEIILFLIGLVIITELYGFSYQTLLILLLSFYTVSSILYMVRSAMGEWFV